MPRYRIWNRAYNHKDYEADHANAALQQAVADGHIKRPTNYRKYEEVRDE